MTTATAEKLITAREAEVYIPPLAQFAGNYRLKAKLLAWLDRPIEDDPNLLIEGEPGTGKTTIVIAYLREKFRNWSSRRRAAQVDNQWKERSRQWQGCSDTSGFHEWDERPYERPCQRPAGHGNIGSRQSAAAGTERFPADRVSQRQRRSRNEQADPVHSDDGETVQAFHAATGEPGRADRGPSVRHLRFDQEGSRSCARSAHQWRPG